MSAERDKMFATLKVYVVPVLKPRGFKGSFPLFRRPTDSAIDLLTFQFDKWGGGQRGRGNKMNLGTTSDQVKRRTH